MSNNKQEAATSPSSETNNASPAVRQQVPSTVVPMTVAGQRYISPNGRHSQQTHRRAEDRAAAQGHGSEREQQDHDRSVVLAKLQKTAERKQAEQRSAQK